MQTVPLHPGGGAQRAYLMDTPSGVFIMPVTAPSGTELVGIETSLIDKFRNGAPNTRMRVRVRR
jgi:hypothetical protein